MDRVAYALMRSGLFGALPFEAFEALLDGLALQPVAPGQVVVAKGDPADACFVVVSGRLQVSTRTPDGGEVVLGELRGRDHFGEQALLRGDAARAATVRAVEPSEVVRVGFDRLEAVFAHAPDLRSHLAELGQQQLEERLSRRTDLVRRLVASVDTRPAERTLPNGHVLYRAGAPTDGVYVVLSGAIELFEDREGARVLAARVGPGLCVGERDGEKRSQTAVIDGTTRVLQVARDALDEITTSSAEARAHLATLERVWALPQRGLVTQHLGTVDGQPCVTQIFHLADGNTLISSHVLGAEAVRLQAARGRPQRTVASPDGQVRVGLERDGRIVAVDGRGAPAVLAVLFARAIEGRGLSAAEEASLAATGEITKEVEDFACGCLRVTRARIRAARAEGATTLEALKQRTGCAMACGSCVPGLLELLGESAFRPIRIGRRQALGAALRLTLEDPAGAPLPPAQPGQHVVLRAPIGGEVVARAYTLSGAAGGPWEITVAREGRFTGWLFDQAGEGTALEASEPTGTCTWDGGPAPVVCLVSGIGLTPALCFARTLVQAGWPHALVVDWSTRHEADTVWLGELPRVRLPNLQLRPRFTSTAGRITESEVHAYVKRYPSARFFLCGSRGYMETVAAWLRAAGVPPGRILVESFEAGVGP